MNGRAAASGIATVHDVVVDEGARLNEFHRGRGADDGFAILTTSRSPTPVQEQRSKPFATVHEVVNGVDEGAHIGAYVIELGPCRR